MPTFLGLHKAQHIIIDLVYLTEYKNTNYITPAFLHVWTKHRNQGLHYGSKVVLFNNTWISLKNKTINL